MTMNTVRVENVVVSDEERQEIQERIGKRNMRKAQERRKRRGQRIREVKKALTLYFWAFDYKYYGYFVIGIILLTIPGFIKLYEGGNYSLFDIAMTSIFFAWVSIMLGLLRIVLIPLERDLNVELFKSFGKENLLIYSLVFTTLISNSKTFLSDLWILNFFLGAGVQFLVWKLHLAAGRHEYEQDVCTESK